MKRPYTLTEWKDREGEWRWRLLSGNGAVVAEGFAGYTRRFDMRRVTNRLFISRVPITVAK